MAPPEQRRRSRELTYDEMEQQDRMARRLGLIPEYRRVKYIPWEEDAANEAGPNYCIKCSSISRIATGGTTVIRERDGRDELKNEFFDILGMEISTPEEW